MMGHFDPELMRRLAVEFPGTALRPMLAALLGLIAMIVVIGSMRFS